MIMTTFEALILLAVIAVEIIFVIHSDCVIKELKEIKYTQSGLNSKLQSILDVCNQQQNAWACDVTTIVKSLNKLTNIAEEVTNEGGTLQQQLNDLEINVKGNYNTLEQQ